MKKLITILILTVIASSAFCKTITVTSSADSGVGTLRQAVTDADVNDSIIFNDSITIISLTSHIKLEKNITIIGDSINTTILSAPNSRHFTLSNIDNYVIASLKNLTLKDGYFYTCGGSIYNLQGNSLYLDKCVFDNNKSGSTSGTIYNYGILNINHCLFRNNTCNGTSSVGVIYNRGQMYIYNSIFTENQGMSSGCLMNSNYTKISNSLFIKNITTNTNGGVIFNYNTGNIASSIDIINTTISDNTGVGLYTEPKIKLYNSIIFNNTVSDIIIVDDSIDLISVNHNLLGSSNINFSNNGNILNIDPLFVGNGDYSLQSISPAINTGNNSLIDFSINKDLSGNKRICDNIIDLGAYEYQTLSSVPLYYNNNLRIYSQNQTIYIEKASSVISIYNTMGQLVTRGTNTQFTIPMSGVYIVCVDNSMQKVIVK